MLLGRDQVTPDHYMMLCTQSPRGDQPVLDSFAGCGRIDKGRRVGMASSGFVMYMGSGLNRQVGLSYRRSHAATTSRYTEGDR